MHANRGFNFIKIMPELNSIDTETLSMHVEKYTIIGWTLDTQKRV